MTKDSHIRRQEPPHPNSTVDAISTYVLVMANVMRNRRRKQLTTHWARATESFSRKTLKPLPAEEPQHWKLATHGTKWHRKGQNSILLRCWNCGGRI